MAENYIGCLCVDLMEEADRQPTAELVIANLLIEYIGYACFQKTIRQVEPVHHQIEEAALEEAMMEIGYHTIKRLEHPLPNGKKLVQMDFQK